MVIEGESMRPRLTTTGGFALALATASWVAAYSSAVQPAAPPQLPANHSPVAPAVPPSRAIGDLTARVATSLPAASSRSPLTERTLIDRQLMRAWARDQIPHAPLADDYEFC